MTHVKMHCTYFVCHIQILYDLCKTRESRVFFKKLFHLAVVVKRYEGDRESGDEGRGEDGDSGDAAERGQAHRRGGRPQVRGGLYPPRSPTPPPSRRPLPSPRFSHSQVARKLVILEGELERTEERAEVSEL